MWAGWRIVGVASVVLVATSPGQTFIVSLYNLQIREELGLSASALSGAYLLATLGSASLMTWVGKASDRLGPGRFMLGAALGLFFATAWMSQISGLWTLTLGFFGLRLFGQGALSLGSGHALAMWFERRLGIAEGVRLTAFGLAMLVLPATIVGLVQAVGWRWSWPVAGSVACLAVWAAVLTLHRDRPEDLGTTLDGDPPPPAIEPTRTPGSMPTPAAAVSGATLSEALRSPTFWVAAATGVNSAMVATAVMFHIQPLALAAGLQAEQAPALIAAYALLATSLFFVCGWIGDRLNPSYVFAGAATLIAAGALAFTSWVPAWGPAVGMAAMGTASALLGTSLTPTLARCFGRAHHGTIRGAVSTMSVAGSAVGPFLLGLSVDWTGAFDTGLVGFAAYGGAVALAALSVRLRPAEAGP